MTALPAGRVSAAALLTLPWCLLLVALALLQPATDANWLAADPILGFFPHAVNVWGVPALGLVLALVWVARARPSAQDLRWSLVRAAAGVVSAGLIVGTIRWISGPLPPPFIPTEESTAPGILLGLNAGVGEELIFRLMWVPILFWALERRMPKMPAMALTAILTGVVFSVVHALGPGDPPLAWHISRCLLPGALMTFAFLRLGPAFLITAHFAAHIWIPLLFR
ncbi:MAG: CPBP family intramembrane metalloprotease [Oligoflexia bacterium]|nr:CPBP family intramembrane metalloprotease [Oligoflexia bacterium]